jgi:hypothetical protein
MNVGLLIFILSVTSLLLIRYSSFSRLQDYVRSRVHTRLGFDAPSSDPLDVNRIRFYFSIVITLAILISSLLVILQGSYPDSTEKWAYGAIGTVSGYWLKA